MIGVDLAADLVHSSVTSMTAKPILVIAGEWVVIAVFGVCGNFRGLYVFPSLVLMAFDCGSTERWVLANRLAARTTPLVSHTGAHIS